MNICIYEYICIYIYIYIYIKKVARSPIRTGALAGRRGGRGAPAAPLPRRQLHAPPVLRRAVPEGTTPTVYEP